ncbi:putative lipoprotein [Alteromonas macleodii]|uniref:Lipoprotein n=1 Tax=Alteromonas macleodii TaxID=28108 RepID=A0AB36FUG9_ALTMA|nr:putative lipoprotein [Alteromonas macleodii]OES35643.1 putative lipoprotein [Alteromonas macleodii]OES41554.1 putative lipoprotein [Alteromonas macleodii]
MPKMYNARPIQGCTILGVAGCHVNAYRPKMLKRKARGDNNQQ